MHLTSPHHAEVRTLCQGVVAFIFIVSDTASHLHSFVTSTMFFRAPQPSLSDDETYEYRRRRPRRRRRHRPHQYDYKSHRHQSPSSTCGKLLLVTALVCLLIYEIVVLHGPIPKRSKLSTRPSQSPTTTTTTAKEQQNNRFAELAARARAIEEAAAARDRDALKRQKERIAAAFSQPELDAQPDPNDIGPPAERLAAAFSQPKFDVRPDPNDIRPPAEKLAAEKEAAAQLRSHPGLGENFWEWHQKSRKGGKIRCREPHQRLCGMTYKFVRKYRVRTLYDADCGRTSPWMRDVLVKITREIWGFRYICANPNASTRKSLNGLPYVTYTTDKWWRAGFPPDVDLVFAWDVLAHTAYGRVWGFFVNIKKANVKYVLVDNYPGILNDPSPERFYLNLRKHPFRFPAAKEVVQNVTEPGETANRQLLFYETTMLPDNLR